MHPPARAADGVTVTRIAVNGTAFNPCTNENVALSGTALLVIERSSEQNRGLQFHSVDIALKGVGETTGTRYIDVFAITISLQGKPRLAAVRSQRRTWFMNA